MTTHLWHGIGLLAGALLLAIPATAAEPIGLVKTLSGGATVTRAGAPAQPLAAGTDVYQDDVIATGTDGSLGITFRDDTTLSMGPKGRMVLDEFAFDPAHEDVKLGVRLMRGTFAMVSGQAAKLAPEKVAVKTPTMTIGIRGTSFLIEVAGDE